MDQIYTSKDGNTFCGWCLDEACEESFGYTDPITQDMTLYAQFIPTRRRRKSMKPTLPS